MIEEYIIMDNTWNSIPLINMVISILTPVTVVTIGYILDRNLKRMENKQFINQKIIDKRISFYDTVVPLLNDILCYHLYIGNWKELSIDKIIEYKRKLDKEFNIYSPLFSGNIMQKYEQFMELCYSTMNGWGNDATIKSSYTNRQRYAIWGKNDENKFDKNYISKIIKDGNEKRILEEKKESYKELINSLFAEMDIMKTPVNEVINTPTSNF